MGKRPNDINAFLKKTLKQESGCWIWKGTKNEGGYGYFKYQGKMRSAHRLSYIFHKGTIPEHFQIDHICNIKLCVNPEHLEAVTAKENTRRNPNHIAKQGMYKKECINGHDLTDSSNIRYYMANNKIQRRCAKCRQLRKN